MTGRIPISKKYLLAGLFALTASGGLLGWWNFVRDVRHNRSEIPILVAPVDEGYVGSRSCADCHYDIWIKYQSHPMAHSLASVRDASPVEDYEKHLTFQHPESRQYRVERLSDRVVHHESMTDDQGEIVYDQSIEIRYAVGSGKRGRSYLFDRGDGLLYISPIAWYSTAGRWDIAPGYVPLSHARFERRANDECLTCHAGRLAYDRRLPDRYAQPPFLEEAIGCERCHGPGAGHIHFHATSDRPAPADPIVNPSALDPARRDDICNRCHLSDAVRLLRHGRSTHDFQPGMRLEDVWAVLVGASRASAAGTTRSINQVHQMRDSRCFQASSGSLGCMSCHDPHGIPNDANRIGFYNERCLNCHRERGCSLPELERMKPAAEGSCIACHMPSLAASDVPHTAQTDHRIPRLQYAPAVPPRRKLRFFDASDARLPPLEVERAGALMQLFHPDHRSDADEAAQLMSSLSSITDRFPDDVDAWTALGNLYLLQNRPAEAQRSWQQALQFQPLHEGILKSLAVLQSRQHDPEAAITTTRQLLRADPWQAEYHVQLAQFLDDAGALDEAVREVERALEINPTQLSDREWLAAVYRKLGRTDDAQHQERLVERMRNR